MNLSVEEDRLLVISDLHLGSPASSASDRIGGFLEHARKERWNLCINGDGFDLLQSSARRLLGDGAPVFRQLQGMIEDGLTVYYTLGNHDIVLEHLLQTFPLTLAPFLNVRSGDARIRIEHGHLYEPFYAKHPHLYEFGGRFGRTFLLRSADWYRVWAWMQHTVDRRRRRVIDGRSVYPHHVAAEMLFERGHDAVVLGHTHLPERSDLPDGLFVNSGSWMKEADVVRVERGEITLESW